MDFFWTKYIMIELKKSIGEFCLTAPNIDATFWRKTELCFLKMFVYSLKNSGFILESKMAELIWKQNLQIFLENCQNVPYSQ